MNICGKTFTTCVYNVVDVAEIYTYLGWFSIQLSLIIQCKLLLLCILSLPNVNNNKIRWHRGDNSPFQQLKSPK